MLYLHLFPLSAPALRPCSASLIIHIIMGGTESHQFKAEPPFTVRPPQAWTEWGAFPLPTHSTPGNVFHRFLRPGAPLTPPQRYSKGSVLASLRTTFTSGKASCRRQAISAAMGHSVP